MKHDRVFTLNVELRASIRDYIKALAVFKTISAEAADTAINYLYKRDMLKRGSIKRAIMDIKYHNFSKDLRNKRGNVSHNELARIGFFEDEYVKLGATLVGNMEMLRKRRRNLW